MGDHRLYFNNWGDNLAIQASAALLRRSDFESGEPHLETARGQGVAERISTDA
jgi:hypothetical protein